LPEQSRHSSQLIVSASHSVRHSALRFLLCRTRRCLLPEPWMEA
jgi:hypothetical protein